ncbi:MAG TPA: SDR family oxidoreductase [Longimicrobiales bacterium]|nr:SDR family oxidoreductase [Longimicrobiales bacterium]
MAEMKGSVAIVTGAASGIGRATALFYAREGARVIVSDVADDGGAETVELIGSKGGDAHFVRTDVTEPAACEALVRRAVEQYGRLDFACNNAGISGESGVTGEYSIEAWDKVVAVNLSSVFYCMRYQIPAMLENGGGAIVNMASILGTAGFASAPAYVAAKHGVVGLTKTAALEYATKGIRVNAVGPGFISTPLISQMEEDEATNEMLVSLHAMGRLGKADEVAELVIFLSSKRASFITGAYYPVDGGYLAR